MVDETYQDIRSKYTLFLAGDDNSNQVAVYDNSNVEIVVRDVLLLLWEQKMMMVTTDKDTRLGRPRFDDDTIISSKSFSIFFFVSFLFYSV